jgi:DNA-binding XRE family transcriptional regulator
MSRKPLLTYLRTYRRRTGLSQEEIAFLLGGFTGATVSRHETATRMPVLQNALMYELVFAVPVKDLYFGIYQAARSTVLSRANSLRNSLVRQSRSTLRDRKIAALDELIRSHDANRA